MNIKKCVAASVLCLLLVVLAVCGLSACADCSHEWGAWTVTKDASCHLMGMRERECAACGEIEKEAIEATGHQYGEWIDAVDAVCGTYGQLGHYHCDGCDTDFDANYNVIANLSVIVEHEWLDATCTKPKTCKHCDMTEGEALGHINTCANIGKCGRCGIDYNGTLTHIFDQQKAEATYRCADATCEEAALYYYSCVCGNKGTETFKYGDPLGHSYSVWTSNGDGTHTRVCINDDTHVETAACAGGEASCTERAECAACGEEYGDLPAHAWDNGVVANAATCTTNGTRRFTCDVCHTTKTEPIVATGHVWSGVRTCENGRTCSVYGCGAEEPALNHAYVEIDSTSADCTNAATKTYECSTCHDVYTETIGEANGHNFTGVSAVEVRVGETCEYVLWYKCNACHEDIEKEHVFRHTYTGSITTAPTCLANGVMTYTCTNTNCASTADKHSYTAPIKVDETNKASYHLWNEGTVVNNKRTDECEYCHTTREVSVYDSNVAEDTASNLSNTDLQLKLDGATAQENVNVNLGNALNGINESVKLEAEKLEGDQRPAMPAGTAAQVGDNPVYNFSIKKTGSNEPVSNFGDEYVTVTLPYTLAPGEDADAIFIWFVTTNEETGLPEVVSIKAEYNNAGFVTFKTNHFSYYTVTRLTPEQRCAYYGCSYRTTVFDGGCVSDSYKLEVCVRCHKTVKTVTNVADGHAYAAVTTEATCTANGKTVYTCEDCGHSYEIKIPATGHAWTTTVVPATCEENGYTTYVCDNCDYTYTDSIVLSTGHDYAPVWTWAEDYSSVTVTFVCANDDEHSFDGAVTLTVKTMPATCTKGERTEYTAKTAYNGIVYTDLKSSGEGTPNGHSYTTAWKYDATQHWHVCTVCGVKADSAAHDFATSTVSVQPTCIADGERVYHCACGATKTEVIAKTGTHLYESGVCVHCGKKDGSCDHKPSKEVTLDPTELGACGGSPFTYMICECGDVKTFDMESLGEGTFGACFFEFDEIKDETAEDGTETVHVQLTCRNCGLTIDDVNIVKPIGGCEYEMVYDYSFSMNGEPILEHVIYKTTEEMHDDEEDVINLSEYSTCGGTVEIMRCKDCDKVTAIETIHGGCNGGDLEGIMTQKTYTENGVQYFVGTVDCPDCGLKFVQMASMKNPTPCETEMTMTITVYNNDEIIVTSSETGTNTQHEMEYTYEIEEGKSCEEGYKVIASCKRCGMYTSYKDNMHNFKEGMIDLSEFTECGGVIYIYECEICGYLDDAEMDINCDCTEVDEEVMVDGVLHERETMTCNTCGLKYVIDEWMEETSACITDYYFSLTVYKGTEMLYKGIMHEREEDHDYEYDIAKEGDTCEDGWTIKLTCNVCGEKETRMGAGHMGEWKEVDLGELGLCGGSAEIEYCVICDMTINSWIHDECKWMDIGEDASGYHESVCLTCGAKRHHKSSQTEKDENCRYQYTNAYIYYKNNEIVYQYEESYTNEDHDYEVIDSTLRGETCEDGYEITYRCKDCGYTWESWGSGHNIESVRVELSELGMCRGTYAYEYTCKICNTVTGGGVETWSCNWENNGTNDDGYEVSTCRRCGAQKLYKQTKSAKDENCNYIETTEYKFILNGETIYELTTNYKREGHTYEYTFDMNGTTCEEGYTVYEVCTGCGDSGHWEQNGHSTYRKVRYDLTEYGACNGYFEVYSCPCGAEAWTNSNYCMNMTWTNDSGINDDGHKYHAEVGKCRECDLYISKTYYSVRNAETCMMETHYSYVINVGTLLDTVTYVRTEIAHDYEVTASLVDGATSCNDGVNFTYVCKDCGHTYEDYETYHKTYIIRTIDLDQYGSVCHGYLTEHVCACGQEHYINRDEALCELDSQGCDMWIDDYLTESQNTTDGWSYVYDSHYIYTCAVTDPVQCELKIRYATYWLWDKDNCTAYRYETWQLGYDQATDIWMDEITFKTGDKMQYHDYLYSDLDNGHRYTCQTCNGYYQELYTYNANGNTVKHEILSENLSGNGFATYYRNAETFSYDGEVRTAYNYDWRRAFADGTYDYGETRGVYKHVNGNSFAFVMYDKECYRVGSDDEYWYCNEWAEPTCLTTRTYSDSDGEFYTEPVDRHPATWGITTKEPTCTQPGSRRWYCPVCDETISIEPIEPDHNWYQVEDDLYRCSTCGLENANGASGPVVIEDLTDALGNNENYVLGYYAREDVTFYYFVSLILREPGADGNDEILLADINVTELTNLCGLSVSKSDVIAAAEAEGLTVGEYDVRVTFVPEGVDEDVDCAITFTDN